MCHLLACCQYHLFSLSAIWIVFYNIYNTVIRSQLFPNVFVGTKGLRVNILKTIEPVQKNGHTNNTLLHVTKKCHQQKNVDCMVQAYC